MTQQLECPGCGTPVVKNHRCRASSLLGTAITPGLPEGFLEAVEEQVAAQRAQEAQAALPLDHLDQRVQCAECGATDRAIVHKADQLCMPCLVKREAVAS